MKMFIVWIAAIAIIGGGYWGYTQYIGDTPKEPVVTSGSSDPYSSGTSSEKVQTEPINKPTTGTTVAPPPKPQPTVNQDDQNISIGSITADMKGSYIKTQGYVSNITGGKGHTFFTFSDPNSGASLKGVLFRQENEKNTGRKDVIESAAQTGALIHVEGKVDVYQGELEVIVKKVY